MPLADFGAGVKRWIQTESPLKTMLITGTAEMMGTSILVFLGCMGCVASLGVVPSHLQIALTFGFAVFVVIQCIGHISQAHINPAITVGAIVLGKKTIPEALVYIVSQISGAVSGYSMLKMLTPKDRLTAGLIDEADTFCVTGLHAELSVMQGLALESFATGVLMLVVCSIWDIRNEKNSDSVPIKFGFTVALLAITVGPYTGCSMNPARSFAPALWNNQWKHHWIYWLGPISGALMSSLTYRTIFGVRDKVEEEELDVPEAVALNSVDTHKTEQS